MNYVGGFFFAQNRHLQIAKLYRLFKIMVDRQQNIFLRSKVAFYCVLIFNFLYKY